MRGTALVAAIMVPSLSIAGAQTITPDQVRPTGLVVGYQVDDYFGEAYTAISRESFVFFQSEPIAFRIQVRNSGPSETALVVGSTDLNQLFRVQGFKGPPIPYESTVERPRSADRYLDETDFTMSLVISSPFKRWSGGTFAVPMEREFRLDPGEGVEWIVNFPSDNLQPGLYRFVMNVNGSERGGRPLRSNAHLRFEVRANGPEALPEVLRRQAQRFVKREDYLNARAAVAALLKAHANSALAYDLLAGIATLEGRQDEAATHRGNAAAIRAARRDELLLKHSPAARGVLH